MRLAALLLAVSVSPLAAQGVPTLSGVRWIVPSGALPAAVSPSRSNNNLELVLHERRLYMAFRTAPIHFASPGARMVVISSADLGRTWTFEAQFDLGRDVREPHLLSLKGRLFLYFLELGRNPFQYAPRGMRRSERLGPGRWSEAVPTGAPGEIVWDMKVRGGFAWKASYAGNHYGLSRPDIKVFFEKSRDGLDWKPASGGESEVYRGGVSEASFEFDRDGGLWAVTRNEDGDETGWGSHLVKAPAGKPGAWVFPAQTNPERYDSPKLFAQGGELYLLARRDLGGPFDRRWRRLPFWTQKWLYLASYWLRPKRTALYKVDQAGRRLVHLFDLPSAGDTAFPAVVRLSPTSFLIGNYSSPPEDSGRSWVRGQLGRTGIYLAQLNFP